MAVRLRTAASAFTRFGRAFSAGGRSQEGRSDIGAEALMLPVRLSQESSRQADAACDESASMAASATAPDRIVPIMVIADPRRLFAHVFTRDAVASARPRRGALKTKS